MTWRTPSPRARTSSSRTRVTTGPDATHLDRWIHHYGANVAVAEHARTVAASVYGGAPHHGYIYGGSGGAGRTIACLEHAPDGPVRRRGRLHPPARRATGAVRVRRRGRACARRRAPCRSWTRRAPGGSGDPFAGAHRGATRRAGDAVRARVPTRRGGPDPSRVDRAERRRPRTPSTWIPGTSTTSGPSPATRARPRACGRAASTASAWSPAC